MTRAFVIQGLRSALVGAMRNHLGLCVLVVVGLLLKGFGGTLETLSDQGLKLASAFLAGEADTVSDVVRQTAPLALSVAVVSLLVFRRRLPADARGPFIAALVILAGAWLGNELRYRGQSIPPLAIMPKLSGVFGAIAKAIDQLAGYARAYRLNLFFASIIVGIYLGWVWHQGLRRCEAAIRPLRPSLDGSRRKESSGELIQLFCCHRSRFVRRTHPIDELQKAISRQIVHDGPLPKRRLSNVERFAQYEKVTSPCF